MAAREESRPPVEISIRVRSLGSSGGQLTLAGALQLATAGQAASTSGNADAPNQAVAHWLHVAGQGGSGGAGVPAPSLPASLSQLFAVARGAASAASEGGASATSGLEALLGGRDGNEGGRRSSAGSRGDASGDSASALDASASERVQRISGAVAGSIFSDLIIGALRPGDTGPPPASERAIRALPKCPHPDGTAQCPVCLLNVEDDATKMPCGHIHHTACLTKWLRSHNTCPVCRHTIEADETPRPSSLSALLQGWRDSRMRAEAAGTPASGGDASPSFSIASPATGMLGDGRLQVLEGTGGSGPSSSVVAEADLMRMSVSELKQRLRQLGVDTSGVVEKRELQDLLRHHSSQTQQQLRVQVQMEVMQLPNLPGGRAAIEAFGESMQQIVGRTRATSAQTRPSQPPSTASATSAAALPRTSNSVSTHAALQSTDRNASAAGSSPPAVVASPAANSSLPMSERSSRRRQREATQVNVRETRQRTRHTRSPNGGSS